MLDWLARPITVVIGWHCMLDFYISPHAYDIVSAFYH